MKKSFRLAFIIFSFFISSLVESLAVQKIHVTAGKFTYTSCKLEFDIPLPEEIDGLGMEVDTKSSMVLMYGNSIISADRKTCLISGLTVGDRYLCIRAFVKHPTLSDKLILSNDYKFTNPLYVYDELWSGYTKTLHKEDFIAEIKDRTQYSVTAVLTTDQIEGIRIKNCPSNGQLQLIRSDLAIELVYDVTEISKVDTNDT